MARYVSRAGSGLKGVETQRPAAVCLGRAMLLLALALVPPSRAQEAVSSKQDIPSYKVRVELVSFDVEVLDRTGEPIRGLARQDFLVREDGRPREIVSFSWFEQRAVSLACVLDTGGMSRDELVTARRFVSHLAHLLGRDDDVAILTYDQRDAFVDQDFTHDRQAIQEALDNIDAPSSRKHAGLRALFGAGSRTGLAIDTALYRLPHARNGKKAVLLISNSFRGLGPATVDHVQEAGFTVMTLSFRNPTNFLITMGGDDISRRQILRESGGRDFSGNASDLVSTVRSLARSLKNHYSLTFHTSLGGDARTSHRVEVSLPGKDFKVHYRRSFGETKR
jgi:Ca-activated chloride channel homolog